jgi:MATE family multidrug resistance protein
VKDKERQALFWKDKPVPELVRLAWPITVSMLSYSVMTLVDTVFVGRLGAKALAAVGLGGVAAFAVICFGFGLLRSVKVLVSQALGADRRDTVPAFVAAGWVGALGLGALMLAVGQLVARALPALTSDVDAGIGAGAYLAVRSLAAPLVLAGVALREARYGLGDSRSPMRAAVIANLLHIGLDALLIWGLGMGVVGAAWSTVLAQLAETALLVKTQAKDGLGWGALRLSHLREMFRLGLPLGFQFLLEVGAFAVLVAMLARIGAVDLAAHQIALQVIHFSFLPAFALGEAASVLAGQAVGANEDSLVRAVARRAMLAAGVYTGGCALVLALAAEPIAALFTSDPAVVALTARLFWVAAVFQVFDAANIVARSVLRGAGDVRYPAVLAVTIAWVCTPPLTWLLGQRLGWGALGGWLGLCVEIVAGALILWWRLERCHWHASARDARARMASDAGERPELAPVVAS